jgi:predicted Zn-dependent protease
VNVGNARAESNRFDDAIQLWRQALAREPYNSTARLNLAQLLLRRSQPQDALREFEILLRYDPDRPEVARIVTQLKARLHLR